MALLLTAVLLYQVVQHTSGSKDEEFAFSKFLQEVQREPSGVKEVTISDSDIRGKLANGSTFKTVLPMEYPELINILRSKDIIIKGEHPTQNPWLTALMSWAPFIFIIGFWIFFMR